MNLKEAINKLKETQDSYLKDELDEAIETVIGELFAMQNLLDEKNEEIEHLQKENKKVTEARDWYFECTVRQIATPELLDKILKDKYINIGKIIKLIKGLENKIEKYEEYRKQGIETDVEYYENIADNFAIRILEDLLKEE